MRTDAILAHSPLMRGVLTCRKNAASDLHRNLPGWEGEAEIRQVAGPGEKICDQARETQAAQV